MGERTPLGSAVRAVLAAGTSVGVGVGGSASAQDDIAVQQKVTVTGSRLPPTP